MGRDEAESFIDHFCSAGIHRALAKLPNPAANRKPGVDCLQPWWQRDPGMLAPGPPPLTIGDPSRAHPRCPLQVPGTSLGRSGCATTCSSWGDFSQNWLSSVFLPPAILGGGFGRLGNYSRSCFQAGVDGEQRLQGSAAELRARGKSKT